MKFLIIIFSMLSFSCLQAQKKPVKSGGAKKGVVKKGKRSTGKKQTTVSTEFEELSCYLGGACTFNVLKNDTFVYEVSSAGKVYDLNIIPLKFVENSLADFNWQTSDGRRGHVVVAGQGLKSARKIISLPQAEGELKLNDASFIWLGEANYLDLEKRETLISIDNAAPEKFVSPDADAVNLPINYKGKKLELDGFAIETAPEGTAGRKEIDVLNISNNLLIIRADLGQTTITLKEVKESFLPAASGSPKKAAPIKKKRA